MHGERPRSVPRAVSRVAAQVVGDGRVDPDCDGILAAEDFAFFLQQIPGAYAFGNGPVTEQSGPVHNPAYDFNDDIIEPGARFGCHRDAGAGGPRRVTR